MGLERKQKIILGVIIVVILIAAIILIIFWPSEYNRVYNKQYADCIKQNKAYYTFLMAQKTGDTKYCEEVGEKRDKCLAYVQKNPTLYCPQIKNEISRQVCVAEISQDPSKCPAADTWCIAEASRDPRLCENLDELDVLECKRSLPQNAEYWISEESKQECKTIATDIADG